MKLRLPSPIVALPVLIASLGVACSGQPLSLFPETGPPTVSPAASPPARLAPSPSPSPRPAIAPRAGPSPIPSPAPSPSGALDRAMAERTIREYYALLGAQRAEEARALLSPGARERNSLGDVAEVAAAFQDIAVTDLQPLDVSPARAVYRALLSVTLRPDAISPFADGENARFVELLPTRDGWRINQVAGAPIE